MSNSILVIHPYYLEGIWVFDDETRGLKQEPFIAGIDKIIDLSIEKLKIKNSKRGFHLIFSENKFPSFNVELEWVKEENGGNWYRDKLSGVTGWLCPALEQYFESTPSNIYIEMKEKK